MSQYETVTLDCRDGLGVVTLNRPNERNAMNQKMRLEMAAAVTQADQDENVRVVVIAAAGKTFCAGADLAESLPGSDVDGFVTELVRTEYNGITKAIVNAQKPVVGLVNGAAAGFGGAVALACDLLMMADDAFLYSAFGAISLIPDGGSHKFLLSYLGSKKAYEMIAFSQRVTAKQCLGVGIANRTVASELLLEEGMVWAKELAKQAPLTLRLSKQLLKEAATANLDSIMEREAQLQNVGFRSEDFKEGTTAFFEKRAPQFKGC